MWNRLLSFSIHLAIQTYSGREIKLFDLYSVITKYIYSLTCT